MTNHHLAGQKSGQSATAEINLLENPLLAFDA